VIRVCSHDGYKFDDPSLDRPSTAGGLLGKCSPARQKESAGAQITPWLRLCSSRGTLPSTAFSWFKRCVSISAAGAPRIPETRTASSVTVEISVWAWNAQTTPSKMPFDQVAERQGRPMWRADCRPHSE
jgi:hypothetical protein